ncbi:NACHT and WD repeat domain-containing 2 [Brachionus plicatilis]|uniref:NACHT and WD repeat domain-containing 2 n=1 Tax=Brachionus plicatilis TaxID=10195 RepID=A0A3M7RY44_BRAPC|nr:NACHT and WD repeat domain-containing 2 [Brachionus plicatilis]
MSETPAETLDLNYDLLMGRFLLNNLPTLKPRSIRIFLCAPYNDTNLETACLYKNVFPKLREYCMSRYGLEFQVVNLNWDIETESVLLDESLLEIDKCREISIGIIFLSLIGDEYGTSILPDFIERSKYEAIIRCLKEAEVECSTLENYFRLNINYLSNRYEFEHDGINLQVKERILELLKIGAKMACDKKLICNDSYNELNESDRKASYPFLNLLTESASVTVAGRAFHSFTILLQYLQIISALLSLFTKIFDLKHHIQGNSSSCQLRTAYCLLFSQPVRNIFYIEDFESF